MLDDAITSFFLGLAGLATVIAILACVLVIAL